MLGDIAVVEKIGEAAELFDVVKVVDRGRKIIEVEEVIENSGDGTAQGFG